MRDLSHTGYNSTLPAHAGGRKQGKSVSEGKNWQIRWRPHIILAFLCGILLNTEYTCYFSTFRDAGLPFRDPSIGDERRENGGQHRVGGRGGGVMGVTFKSRFQLHEPFHQTLKRKVPQNTINKKQQMEKETIESGVLKSRVSACAESRAPLRALGCCRYNTTGQRGEEGKKNTVTQDRRFWIHAEWSLDPGNLLVCQYALCPWASLSPASVKVTQQIINMSQPRPPSIKRINRY